MNNASAPRLRRWLIVGVIALVVVPGGYYLARHHGWPAYKNWRGEKLARMTRQFMESGDYDNALLTARQALRDNQRSLVHWRLATEAAKAKQSGEAIYYQQNVARLDKTLASRIELIRLALQHGVTRSALDAIENAQAEAKDSPEFHELAARTYLGVGRTVKAKMHLYSLIDLQPDNHTARLDLAELELAEDSEGRNTELRERIDRLSEIPELRVRALSLLLRDAISAKSAERALAYAERLSKNDDLNGEQKVLVLAGLAHGDESRAEEYRKTLQTEFAEDPASVVALAEYLRESGSPMETRKWFDSLPRETRENPSVQEAIAASFLEWREWARLDQTLAAGPWNEREFMRQAFIAYSARKTSRFADAGNAWRLAVIQAGDSPRKISELLTLVARWGWQTEQYDLVWKLFALMPRNESISRQLIAWEHHHGRTANLNRIYARLVEFSPEDAMMKNNFAYTSLLLNANLSKAYEYARENFRAEPENPFFVTTQALALYKQDKPKEALALLETLRPAALASPERQMYRALFRAKSGDAAGAADLLSGFRAAKFLPEERRLVEATGTEIARLDRQRGEELRLFALDTRGEIDRSKGWMRGVPDLAPEAATVEMQAADSLFAMGDVAGLSTHLRKGGWGEHEHLRLALIAYVSRQRGDESAARSYWRTAMGTAGTHRTRLQQLRAIASSWEWKNEAIDALARLYEGNPSNEEQFAELMRHYRAVGRTGDMVAVLNAYLSAHPGDQTQRCELAYYSMLSGLNLARAYVAAQEVYLAAPEDPRRRTVYAFSLWKQRRAKEAWDVLEQVSEAPSDLVPIALLRAAVLADMERREDAAEALQKFDPSRALPEEARIAALVEDKLKGARVSRVD
jgi:Uncharacterized enzyme of heme biosynthesis